MTLALALAALACATLAAWRLAARRTAEHTRTLDAELTAARAELARVRDALDAAQRAPRRVSIDLSRLDAGRGTRKELSRMVDDIARIGDFSSVVLSDGDGLPLAVNRASTDGEQLAGLWSMLLTLADRVAATGAPAPIAIAVHDDDDQTLLHRLFSSAGSRYVLTAVSRDPLPANALDPAIGKLARVLAARSPGLTTPPASPG